MGISLQATKRRTKLLEDRVKRLPNKQIAIQITQGSGAGASAGASAKDRVKASFILGRIADLENIKAEQKEMTQRIIALAEQNKTSPEKMAKSLQERNAFQELAQEIIIGKVLDFVELNAQVEEVATPSPSEVKA